MRLGNSVVRDIHDSLHDNLERFAGATFLRKEVALRSLAGLGASLLGGGILYAVGASRVYVMTALFTHVAFSGLALGYDRITEWKSRDIRVLERVKSSKEQLCKLIAKRLLFSVKKLVEAGRLLPSEAHASIESMSASARESSSSTSSIDVSTSGGGSITSAIDEAITEGDFTRLLCSPNDLANWLGGEDEFQNKVDTLAIKLNEEGMLTALSMTLLITPDLPWDELLKFNPMEPLTSDENRLLHAGRQSWHQLMLDITLWKGTDMLKEAIPSVDKRKLTYRFPLVVGLVCGCACAFFAWRSLGSSGISHSSTPAVISALTLLGKGMGVSMGALALGEGAATVTSRLLLSRSIEAAARRPEAVNFGYILP